MLQYSLKSLLSRKIVTSLFTLGIIVIIVISMLSVNISNQVDEGFIQQDGKYDIVVGAKGSATSLAMSALYFSNDSVPVLEHKYYEELKELKDLQLVVPIAMGDNFRGANIIGTTPELLSDKELTEGEMFKVENSFEAVVGYNVAERFKLKLGDELVSSHGLGLGLGNLTGEEEHEGLILVGILDKTNSAYDNNVFTNYDSVFEVHGIDKDGHGREEETTANFDTLLESIKDPSSAETTATETEEDHAHEEEAHEEDHDHEEEAHAEEDHGHESESTTEEEHDHEHEEDERGFTSILVRTGSATAASEMLTMYDEDSMAQAISPTATVRKLMDNIDLSKQVAQLLTYIIIVLAFIMVAIMTVLMFEGNRKDIQTLRFIGLSRLKIFMFVIYQNIYLLLLGTIISLVLNRYVLEVVNNISSKLGIVIDASKFYTEQWYVLLAIVALCLVPVIIQLANAFRRVPK